MGQMILGVFIGTGLSAVIYFFAAVVLYRQGVKRGREIERYSQAGGIVTDGW